ncbi:MULTISPECIES: HU family DNA-binding protein [unclassified Oceanispirochaeta]|uniref:HU family DNA-binding protein n=1 Tax=unclassified Oceanispirochaeta TaxID=2635722 RepID=UPI0013143496|nr:MULTISPECIES: HU family DNA-binding protein [unclassified Oceanispirochaeta]MBF9014858.1 HU family DNA-binding protein [Oceanispirochaeta sp. M2]NPD71461.1 HU family DNA-binding protein [Oceanispirochaeta sp. M1]
MAIPKQVEDHLERIFKDSEAEWSGEEGAFDKLCSSWEKKERLFSQQIKLLDMDELPELEAGDSRAALLLTFSGSLVSLGPGEKRWLEYASISLRTDVPDIVRCEATSLSSPAAYGKAAEFSSGPLKHTSALYKIVVCKEDVTPSEQEKRVREATVFLTNSFIHLNRDLTLPFSDQDAEQFNKQNIIAYLARKSGLTQDKIREVTDDYVSMMETGMLMGKTVSFGRLGRFSLSLKPSRKARIGRNPKTGEEITIPARGAHWSPNFKFSGSSKDKAEAMPLPEDEES